MFFTRIAIAALSLGSIAKVFAAPVAVGLAAPPAAAVVELGVPSDMNRRLDLPFSVMVDKATATIDAVGAEIDALKEDTVNVLNAKLGSFLSPFVDEVKGLTQQLKAAGADKESLLLAANGVTKLSPQEMASKVSEMINVVNDTLNAIGQIDELDIVEAKLKDLETSLNAFKVELSASLPDVFSLISNLFAQLFVVLAGVLVGLPLPVPSV